MNYDDSVESSEFSNKDLQDNRQTFSDFEQNTNKSNTELQKKIKKYWLSSCKIVGMDQSEGFIDKHTIYQIEYKLKQQDKTYTIQRRYNDFKSLRNKLRKYYPCIYIASLHIDNTMTFENKKNLNEFLKERIYELELFLRYIIENPQIFNNVYVRTFLDNQIKESRIHDRFQKMPAQTLDKIYTFYLQEFPDFKGKNIESQESEVLQMQKNLINSISKYQVMQKGKSDSKKDTKKQKNFGNKLYKDLFLPFAKDDLLEDKYKDFIQSEVQLDEIQISKLEKKLRILLKNMNGFLEIFDDYQKFKQISQRYQKGFNQISQKKSKSKEQDLIFVEKKLYLSQDFLGLLQNLLIKKEIPFLKEYSDKQIKKIIKLWVDQQLKVLEKKMDFLQTLKNQVDTSSTN